jgi:biopolymer transport protein ExbD
MPLKTHQDDQPTLNLTPMIDIVFLLIIFFMVGTKFTELEHKIGLQVPEVTDHDALTDAPERKVVNVHADGAIMLDHRHVSVAELTQQLAAAHRQYSKLGVLIRGDRAASHGTMTTVYNACTKAGVSRLGISVKVLPPQ